MWRLLVAAHFVVTASADGVEVGVPGKTHVAQGRKQITADLSEQICEHKELTNAMWVFPKIMVPPNHPFVHRVGTIINHPFGGTIIFGNTHVLFFCLMLCFCST